MTLATAEQMSSTSGRAANGRFGAGNPGGPGNPNVRRIAAMRQAILEAVSPEDVRDIMIALVAQAKEGDREAAKIVLQYTLGKPGAWDEAADGVNGEPQAPAAPKVREAPTLSAPGETAAQLAPLPPLTANKARCEERLAARREPRPDLTVEQMMGLTLPSTNGVNGPKGSLGLAAIAAVDSAPEKVRTDAGTAKK
jgi:hypothetical protein